MRRRKQQLEKQWTIENNEFHPDPRVAARYSDLNALRYTLRHVNGRLESLKNHDKLTKEDREDAKAARAYFAERRKELDKQIAELEKKLNPKKDYRKELDKQIAELEKKLNPKEKG